MSRAVFWLILLCCAVGCGQNAPADAITSAPTYRKEVEALTSAAAHRSYLEALFAADQRVRDPEIESQVITEHGYDSPAHRQLAIDMKVQDSINFQRLFAYLIKHPYPKQADVGELGVYAPWAIIHHQSNVDDRNRFYAQLAQAHQEGSIDDDGMSLYLQRTLEYKDGYRLDLGETYSAQREIDSLVVLLGLE